MSKEKKDSLKPSIKKVSNLFVIKLCVVIVTITIVCFCYLLTIFLLEMSERVVNIDSNLEIMTHRFYKTSKGLEKTEKKIQESWIL